MKPKLIPILLEPKPKGKCQRKSCWPQDVTPYSLDLMTFDDRYLARWMKNWYVGRFSESWFGWHLWGGSMYIQLNNIDELYLLHFPDNKVSMWGED